MLFNTIEFAIFLPIVFLLYWFVFGRNLKLQNFFVVIVSYVFYGWWDWRFLLLIAFTSLCSWGSGILIAKANTQTKAKTWMILNIIVNLLILGTFKYYNFFVSEFARLFHFSTNGLLLKVVLPVGISFYTFQALSYSIDVYRGKIKPTEDIVAFFAYVSFFPQLVAGPIERATNLLPQFQSARHFEYNMASDGMRQILWGLFKKIVIADNCAVFVDWIFADYGAHPGSTKMLAAVLFSFQIYGDFSGYSDIAIGTSKLFGIRLMRNFNVPYFSRDIAEFWRRWHISLTTWFRDYIYIPLGGSRVTKMKIVRNTFIIFLVSGLWHGANWTFLAWGAYHALLFLPLILMGKNRKYKDVVAENKSLPSLSEFVRMLVTFFLVVIGWIIFRAESIGQAWDYIAGMCQLGTLRSVYRAFTLWQTRPLFILIIIMMVIEWIQRKKEHGLQMDNVPWYFRYPIYIGVSVLIICFFSQPVTFIYFQF